MKNKIKSHKVSIKTKKYCWEARETKDGWKLGLCVGSKVSFMSFCFPTTEAIEKLILGNGNIVFIHLKN
jgi:hypothetical protein